MAAQSKLWKFESSERGIVLELWQLEKWIHMDKGNKVFFFTYAMISFKESSGLDQEFYSTAYYIFPRKYQSAKLRHFPITWKNQILTTYYSVFYMPLSFPGKKNRPKWDTFRLHGKTKSWLLSTQNGLVSSTHVHTSNRWRHRPNWYTFQLHDLLVKSTNFDPARQKNN